MSRYSNPCRDYPECYLPLAEQRSLVIHEESVGRPVSNNDHDIIFRFSGLGHRPVHCFGLSLVPQSGARAGVGGGGGGSRGGGGKSIIEAKALRPGVWYLASRTGADRIEPKSTILCYSSYKSPTSLTNTRYAVNFSS